MKYLPVLNFAMASRFEHSILLRNSVLVLLLLLVSGCSTLESNREYGQAALLQLLPLGKGHRSHQVPTDPEVHQASIPKVARIQKRPTVSVSKRQTKRRAMQRRQPTKLAKLSWLAEDVEWRVTEKSEFDSKACSLSTPTIQIDDHNYTMQVWLYVVNGKLLVNTSSDIDIVHARTGIQTQNGQLIPFSSKPFLNSALWSGDLAQTIRKNDAIRLILRNKDLESQTHEVAINLAHLKHSYAQYSRCSSGTLIAGF